MQKNLRDSLRYLHADPTTTFSQLLVAARNAESEADEFKDLEGGKAKSAVVKEMKDASKHHLPSVYLQSKPRNWSTEGSAYSLVNWRINLQLLQKEPALLGQERSPLEPKEVDQRRGNRIIPLGMWRTQSF